MYYVYMLRCEDNSIYTGMAANLEKRLREHFEQDKKKCAKYTLNHKAKKLEFAWITETRALALKLEYHIKTLTKLQKEELIKIGNLANFLGNKIECDKYDKFEKIIDT